MTASDVVAVMTYTTDLNVLQDFTDDRDVLVDVIKKKVTIGENGMANGSTGDDSEGDTGAAYTADDTEFNIFNTDRKLAALESAVKMLASLPEKKALVYFASGMTKTGMDNQAQLRATINAAIRGNVAFYPVDARGLVAQAPMGDATQASQGGRGMYSGSSQRQAQSNFQGQQETLYTLASDTGGKALLDQNDLSLGIVQAQKAIASYYILGYYSTNGAMDGHFRRIKVQTGKELSAKLDYRSGYFASKEFRKFDSSDREMQLAEALMLGDPVTDLTLAVEVNYFRQAKDRYFVPVSVKIPGSDIELARKSGAESTRLDFIGQVRDSKGMLQGTVRDEIKVKLKGDNLGQLAKRNLAYDTGFTLAPGHVHAEVSGARKRDRQDGDLRNQLRRAGPDGGPEDAADQFRGAQLPARETQRRPGQRRERQEADRRQSAGAGWSEAGAQRDPGLPQGPELVRLPGSLSAGRGAYADDGGQPDLLPRQGEGVRERAAANYRRTERQGEVGAGTLQRTARSPAARPLYMPGEPGATGGGEVRRLAIAGCRTAVAIG